MGRAECPHEAGVDVFHCPSLWGCRPCSGSWGPAPASPRHGPQACVLCVTLSQAPGAPSEGQAVVAMFLFLWDFPLS